MELTNEQRARVFAMYIGSQCINVYKQIHELTTENIHTLTVWGKLLLKPLSAITDEDAIDVAKIEGMPQNAEALKILHGTSHIEVEYRWQDQNPLLNIKDGYSYSATGFSIKKVFDCATFQYLIQQGYAVPLFYGVGHPDNGKNAIELNLAIDATTLSTNQNAAV